MKPVDGLSVMPQFSGIPSMFDKLTHLFMLFVDDALCQVSRTLRQGNMPVFDDVEDLIEEEVSKLLEHRYFYFRMMWAAYTVFLIGILLT